MTGIHRLSAAGVIGAGPTPSRPSERQILIGRTDPAPRSAAVRITSCTNNCYGDPGRDLCLLTNSLSPTRVIWCWSRPSGRIASDKLGWQRVVGFFLLRRREGALFTTHARRADTHAPKEQIIFLLAAPWVLLQSTSIVGAFASLQLCIMPTRATLRAATAASGDGDAWARAIDEKLDLKVEETHAFLCLWLAFCSISGATNENAADAICDSNSLLWKKI